MNAITICVEFHDFLAITLPRNIRYFDRFLVVTSKDDLDTRNSTALARVKYPQQVLTYCTDAFYAPGCKFNKGLALEGGFDVLGREGWICVMDADTVLSPLVAEFLPELTPGNLYMPKLRRGCTDPDTFEYYADSPALWDDLPEIPEMRLGPQKLDGGAGYCQMFHASDPVLATRPWYPTRWRHAGGCDTDFVAKWAREHRVRLDFEILHLGQTGYHWQGRRDTFLSGLPVPHSAERGRAMEQMHEDRKHRGLAPEQLPKEPRQ